MIAGSYIEQTADGDRRTPVFGVTVGLYLEWFRPGTELLDPPQPIATTNTGPEGAFGFCDLPPRSYFLTTIGQGVYTPGIEVQVLAGETVTVELIGCVDCPAPA